MGPDDVLAALVAWSVRFIQFNALVAGALGMTDSELRCLYELDRHGPATPGALARRVNLTTGSASRMVERLHAAGHVRRVPDPADRRRILIEPEPAVIARIGALFAPLDARLLAELADVDGATQARMIEFLTAAEHATEDLIDGS